MRTQAIYGKISKVEAIRQNYGLDLSITTDETHAEIFLTTREAQAIAGVLDTILNSATLDDDDTVTEVL